MLQIQQLTVVLGKDLRTLTEGLTFSLEPGAKAALIGEEGNGKSTLLKLLYDPSLVEDYVEWSGEIHRENMLFGYLSQELSPKEEEQTVYEFCCGEDAFLESSPKELAGAAATLGFPVEAFYSDRPVGTLSGGEKVKLRMALLSLKRPDVYLLDEPSNDLDLSTLRWLEEFIRSCPQPVLYISHDEALLENTANVVIHLEQLRRKTLPRWTVAKMGYARYVQERLNRFSKQEQTAKKEREEEKKQLERFRQIQQRVEHEQNAVSRQDPHGGRLLKKKMKAVKSLEHRFARERESQTEFPDFEEAIFADFGEGTEIPAGKIVADFTLPRLEVGDRILARDVRLYVKGPQHLCILGRNGAGKTTLLREIASRLLARKDIRAAYMPQNYGEALDPSLTPVEFLAKTGEKEELTRIKTYLGSMKYTPEECDHSLSALSGGQKAKLFFLRMILSGANVLILDEPTRNFSPLSGPVIRKMLREFPGCILSVSHDRKYMEECCNAWYELGETGLIPREPPF